MVDAIPNEVLGPVLVVLAAALIRIYGPALMVRLGFKDSPGGSDGND